MYIENRNLRGITTFIKDEILLKTREEFMNEYGDHEWGKACHIYWGFNQRHTMGTDAEAIKRQVREEFRE